MTPNAHALAAHYVLLDNLYCNGEVSEDGHKWCDAAYATAFIERAWPSSYSSRGEPDGDARVADSPAGEIWDNCARHGVSFYAPTARPPISRPRPTLPPVFAGEQGPGGPRQRRSTVSSSASVQAPARHWDGRPSSCKDLSYGGEDRRSGRSSWSPVAAGRPHAAGLAAGAFTPVANVAENDQALGQIVEGISHSRFWKETAIFVIEDDAQNGPDHVDAHRTEGLILSPYVKRGAVDSTQYTTASLVRTMEMILGICRR